MENVANAGAFPPTRWSVVLATRASDPTTSSGALACLCQIYWFPLYAFARRKGFSPEDAEDLTQTFFQTIIEHDLFATSDPVQGKLRTFLLRAFERDLLDARRAARRLKRGGGATILSLDFTNAENRFLAESVNVLPPEMEFDQAWARSILAASLAELEAIYAGQGKSVLFGGLKPFLSSTEPERAQYEQLATGLGFSRAAARQAVHRLREQYREMLRGLVADTLHNPTPASIQDELQALQAALRTAA